MYYFWAKKHEGEDLHVPIGEMLMFNIMLAYYVKRLNRTMLPNCEGLVPNRIGLKYQMVLFREILISMIS